MRNLILSTSLCYRSYRLFFARPSLKSLWSFIKPFFVVRDKLKYKGWPSAIKKLLELKNVTLLKPVCGCDVKKVVIFLSPGLEVTKCLSALNDMMIYTSTPLRTETQTKRIRLFNWSFIFVDNVGQPVESLRSLKCHSKDKLKLFFNSYP